MQININDFLANIKKHIKADKDVFVIGIAGGSGSGKSYLGEKICEQFEDCVIIKMDDYYLRGVSKDNKDVPDALNLDLLKGHLIELKEGKEVEKPIYTFGLKQDSLEVVKPHKIIIVDGLFTLNEKFLDLLDLSIFVDASEKIRLERRLKRDVEERGFTKEHTLKRWNETVEPMFKKHVLVQREKADIVVLNG